MFSFGSVYSAGFMLGASHMQNIFILFVAAASLLQIELHKASIDSAWGPFFTCEVSSSHHFELISTETHLFNVVSVCR